jgi:hypothetical protein
VRNALIHRCRADEPAASEGRAACLPPSACRCCSSPARVQPDSTVGLDSQGLSQTIAILENSASAWDVPDYANMLLISRAWQQWPLILSIESRVEAEFGCDSQATQMSNHRALWWSFSNRGTGSTPNDFARQVFPSHHDLSVRRKLAIGDSLVFVLGLS